MLDSIITHTVFQSNSPPSQVAMLSLQEAAAAFGVLQSALHSQLGSALPSSEQASSGSTPQIASSAADLLKAAEEERTAFDSMLQDVASLLAPDSDTWLEPDAPSDTPIDPTAQEGQQRVPAFVTMLWEVGRLRRSLTVLVMTWAATLHDPVVYARPMSHSHSVPNSLHSLDQGARQLSTDSLPNMACEEEAPLQVGPRHAAPQGAELAQQALQDPGSSAASSEKDSVDDRQQGMSQDGSEPDAVGAHEAGLGAVSSEEQACPVVLGSTPPVLAGGIVAQTILNLERQRAERSPPTRMNAAAAARRFVASALEQRARTLQWLNSSRLSADEVRANFLDQLFVDLAHWNLVASPALGGKATLQSLPAYGSKLTHDAVALDCTQACI